MVGNFDIVNLENDIIGKYVQKFVSLDQGGSSSQAERDKKLLDFLNS